MRILFEQKKPGRTRQDIAKVPVDVEGKPQTVGQLIEATERSMVAAFNLPTHLLTLTATSLPRPMAEVLLRKLK